MEIAGLSIGIEAFHDTIDVVDAHALASLSILSKEWNKATESRLCEQRLGLLRDCFPFIGLDGKFKLSFIDEDIDVNTLPIKMNALVALSRICKQILLRETGCRHPSYREMFELDAFYITNDVDPNIHIRVFHLMMSCAEAMTDCETYDTHNMNNRSIMKVCWTYIIMKFYHQHLVHGSYPEFYEQSILMTGVTRKMELVGRFMKRNLSYVPDVLAYYISKLTDDLSVAIKARSKTNS